MTGLKRRLLNAALWHDCTAIRELVAQGVDVNVRGEGGNSTLISLVQQPPTPGDDADVVMYESLVRFIEDPTYHSTPEEIETIRMLIAHGLRLDLTDAAGMTALSCAVYGNNRPAVDVLLSVGANYLDFNEHSLSSFDVAVREDRHELIGLFLERACSEGRLAAIDGDPRHGRWIDEATGNTAQMLETAFGRSSKEARARVRVLKDAHELEDESPSPTELYFNADGTAIFWRGPILKLCPRCGYEFRNFFSYWGSRYGLVGDYQCPRCLSWYILQDDDHGGSPIRYIIHGPGGYETLMSLDYTRLYRLDALPVAVERYVSSFLDNMRNRPSISLDEVVERLRTAIPALQANLPEAADCRLKGGQVPPPDVAAWLGLVRILLPEGQKGD